MTCWFAEQPLGENWIISRIRKKTRVLWVVCVWVLTWIYPRVYPCICSIGGIVKNTSCVSCARDHSIVCAWIFDHVYTCLWLLGRLVRCLFTTRLFSRQLREKLVEYVESSVRATLNTSVSDVRQIAGTLTVVTSKPEQNTNIMLVGACVCVVLCFFHLLH